MRTFLLFTCSSLLVACGGGDDTSGTDGGTAVLDAAPGSTFTVEWGPIDVPAGTEDTKCVLKRLGNTEQIRINTIHNILGSVSHHFIVYRVNNETVERPDPYACQPFADTLNPANGAPVAITQKSEEVITLPPGVAFTLAPNQMIRLELHYVNVADSPQTLSATTTFTKIPDAEFQYEADFLFAGDVNIDIPPMTTHSLGPTYVPLPTDLDGASFFAITGHEHHWGTNVTVEASAGNQAGTMVYDVSNFSWDEPETVYHSPPFTVPSGGGFRIKCDWYNGSGSQVAFGEGVDDEMCFFWSYYYPSQGARVCFAHSGFGVTACCPGDALCSQLLP